MGTGEFQPKFRTLLDEGDRALADVYWLTHAGGAANTLAYRAKTIELDTPIVLSTPSMPAREELFDLQFEGDLDEIAASLSTEIEAEREKHKRGSLPLIVIGHSFGSVLAYRTVCHLIARDIVPHRLVVLSFPAADRMTYDKQLHTLGDQELIQEVDEMFGGVPENLRNDAAAMKFFTPALRFDLGLLERYRHIAAKQVIAVPITAICGTDDRAVDLADMQRWETMTHAAFRLRSMPGDHFFPLERMAEILSAATWDTASSEGV
jgi:surfactin synthase thioesterase subunit